MRTILLSSFMVCAGALMGCGSEDARGYDASLNLAITEGTAQGDFKFSGAVDVREQRGEALNSVQASGESITQKGTRRWRIVTQSPSGQEVIRDHDDALQMTEVTIDGRTTKVRRRADGFYEHEGQDYKDNDTGRRDLVVAIAGQLKAFRIQDDSAVANFGASKWAADQIHTKFFFTDVDVNANVDVDVLTEIGVNIGAFNSNTF